MAVSHRCGLIALCLCVLAPLLAQSPAERPVEKGLEEHAQVTLVQVDAVVVDKDGRTAPGLTKDDFTMKIAGRTVPVRYLDVTCPAGAAADPAPVPNAPKAAPAPIAPGVSRRVVLVFDYSLLSITMRPRVLDDAQWMLQEFKTDDEEVMIVALASTVRIEQRFTKDVSRLKGALERMKHDVTLWAREFPLGVTRQSWFENISTLMDVLGGYDGAKGVVFFSEAGTVDAAMRDAYYDDVAAHAAAARASIYPAKPDLLSSAGSSPTLTRLANQTGGRMPFFANDLSIAYRRAQRDLSCRYTLSAQVDPAEVRNPKPISVYVKAPGLTIRAPERVQVLTDAARQLARARAAYVDPGPYERPLVRAFAFPSVPSGAKKWNTLLAVSFPAAVGTEGRDVDVNAVVRQNNQRVDDTGRRIHVDPSTPGAPSRSVTILGDTALKGGAYDLTVLLSDPAAGEIVTARVPFVVPEVPEDLLMLRGPVMGRTVPGGLYLRAEKKVASEDTRLGKLLGPSSGFEPLFVEEIESKDAVIFYWSACVLGDNPIPEGAEVKRAFSDEHGASVRDYPAVPLVLTPRGKRVACLEKLEDLPSGALAAGSYTLDVKILSRSGETIAHGTEPLTVR